MSPSKSTKVLLWMPDGDRVPGGHRVQFEKTLHALQTEGIKASLSYALAPRFECDIVHGFALSPVQARQCRSAGRPLVLSTIYWSRAYAAHRLDGRHRVRTLVHRARLTAGFAAAAFRGHQFEKCDRIMAVWQDIRATFEIADLLLPNSLAEGAQIRADLGVTTPLQVVPNAVDQELFTDAIDGEAKTGVLYAGRFDPHKNQLSLIRAMSGTSVPVVLIGHAHPDHGEYLERCKREAGDNIRIVAGCSHAELVAHYRRAKVHCLPSWFETTGLVSLEAAMCGCNIVTTSRGYASEYFGDLAWYCNPADPASVRRAVIAALEAPPPIDLQCRIRNNFSWTHAAKATVGGYLSVLEARVVERPAELHA